MQIGMAILLVVGCLLLGGCQPLQQQTRTATAVTSERSATSADNCSITVSELLGSVNSPEGSDWQRFAWADIARKCPASKVAAHNHIVALMDGGKYDEAAGVAGEAAARFGDFKPLQLLAMRLNDPLALAVKIADEKYAAWLNAKSALVFTRQPPQKQTPSPLPKLIKGEFEKRADFEARVTQAKEERRRELAGIESRYQEAVREYNAAVASHNRQVQAEKKQRLAERNRMREKFLNEAVADIFGSLQLSELNYDSERERFTGRLQASAARFDERVTIAVPLAGGTARQFKADVAALAPEFRFTLGEDGRAAQQMTVRHGGTQYPIEVTSESFTPLAISAVADVAVAAAPVAEIREVRDTITIDDAYYREAISIQDDPALAALRQQKMENERKLAQARAEQALERQRKRIKEDIARQQQQLAAIDTTTGREYEGLAEKYSWNFLPAAEPARDMVAIIIGNRDYGADIPKVSYAYNDARAIKTFLEKGLGVLPENIIVERDATKGVMEGLFLRTLPNRVVAGKTEILVYFSGHGMPKKGEALLLPADTKPEFADIAGYPRDRLLQQLAALGAKDVTVILDACFSGTAKDSAPLVAGKPVFAEVTPVAIPSNTVFISATRAREIARMDKEKGMSLMTFHLLQGLSGKADTNSDRAVSVAELEGYLRAEVPRQARLSFNADQTPEVFGPKERILVRY